MPIPGSQQSGTSRTSQPDLSRSEHTASFLAPAQLAAAQRLTAAQVAKAKGYDISGTDVEQLLADITGGHAQPNRSNRPVADLEVDGVGYSVKTSKLNPVASLPKWQQWLGREISILTSRVSLRDNLPQGKTMFDVRASTLGKRVVEEYNHALEQSRELYGVEKLAVLARLDVPEEQLVRYLYWEEELEPIDNANLIWSDSARASRRAGQSDGQALSRNIRAHFRDQAQASEDRGASAVSWCSNGNQLYKRHEIPANADTWVLPYSMILSRDRVTELILQDIDQQLRG
jgi:hypothetical protein